MTERQRRARELQHEIATVLLRDWDPIGVSDIPEAQGEYDSYVGQVYRLLASDATARQVAEHLLRIETVSMGLGASTVESLMPVAERLIALDVHRGWSSGMTESFAAGNNDFALAMYGQLRRLPGNLFFSPFSLRTALAMTEAGAKGETAAQMRESLRISSSSEAHTGFAEFVQRLLAAGREYELAVANSLWGQEGAPVQAKYLDLIARQYGGGLYLVDFLRAAEAARETINQWVEDQTRRRIQQLISKGALNADTRLVLVNAIYFKGMWVLRFSKAATREQPFYREGGETVQAPLMHQRAKVRYLRGNGYQAVDLAYRGDDLSMLVLLPDRQDGLQELEKTLSARQLDDNVARMDVREVELFLPRFKITWAVEMGGQLAALGMKLAFQRFRADFSGINGYEPPHEESLFISSVFHKAFVAVDEEGTEAAAATAVSMTRSAGFSRRPPPVPVFRADHPFLFAIRERKSGAILFLGRITDPT